MDKRGKQVGHRMLAIYREIEPKVRKMSEDVGSTCRQGCAACCHIQVYISMPEAVALAEPAVKAGREAIADLIRRCYNQLPLQRLDRVEHFTQAVPCVFLTEAKDCAAYDRRPVPCRHHVVVSDPAHCADQSSEKTVQRLDTSKIDQYLAGESLRVMRQNDFPITLAPIPVSVLWAIRLLVEGEHEYRKALASSEDLGILDIRGWTMHAMQTGGVKPRMVDAEGRPLMPAEPRVKDDDGDHVAGPAEGGAGGPGVGGEDRA